ncbi:hypothetical protein D0Z03_001876 [Geotrichum reessii]|nr:hypothetical protein D0Z03_001876 [Galactomyces reessii]
MSYVYDYPTKNTTQLGTHVDQTGAIGSADSTADSKTLWMGELEPWLDEAAIKKIWGFYGENVSVKLIRDKFSGSPSGYCFVEFSSASAAAKALTLNGQPIPNTQRLFKLNWASGGGLQDKRDDRGPEFSIFVGDLSPEVTEVALFQLFQARYPSCKSAKIMIDTTTNTSRGYGFVRFGDETERQYALTGMQGFYAGNRPMRISTATPKSKSLGGSTVNNTTQGGANNFLNQHSGNFNVGVQSTGYYNSNVSLNQFTDPFNTTVFVGGLSGVVTPDELRSYFTSFGTITYVKIPPGKGCGFVQFVTRQSAEAAITQMQGYTIGNSRVRLSWGRSQNTNGPPNTPYRPTPPSNAFPQMAVPPQTAYSAYGPINPQAAHIHSSFAEDGDLIPSGIPPQTGATQIVPGQDPSEPIPVSRLNKLYIAAREGRLDRIEADGRGYHGVYAQ